MRGRPGFVGRNKDLVHVDEAIATGRLLFVMGDAGIGKTCLVAEGLGRAAAASGLIWLAGSCLPLREPLPMLPVIEALREFARCQQPRLMAAIERLDVSASSQISRVLPYSSGAVEGAVTRVKAIKRAYYGRANFDLLNKRFLLQS